VGAITDRTRKLFEDAGIPIYEDATTLNMLEDADTGTANLDRA
jgi:hypothetical protein